MSDQVEVPWLTIIGLGEEFADNTALDVRNRHPKLEHALNQAAHILGPERFAHLATSVQKQLEPWAQGFEAMLAQIKAHQGAPTLILATGDPCHFGIAGSLATYFDADEVMIWPAPSAFSKAAARLGWRLEMCEMISLHGRNMNHLRQVAALGRPILALTSSSETIHQAGELYISLGLEQARFEVLHHMGGTAEHRISCLAKQHKAHKFGEFQILAIHPWLSASQCSVLPQAPFTDEMLVHDNQITKYEQRLLAVAKLAPLPGELLLDIGAGCGAIALEWCRLQPAAFAICVEKNTTRANMIVQNASKFGMAHRIRVICAEADIILSQQLKSSSPDAIFLGGGVSQDILWHKAWKKLTDKGRMMAHAVTFEGRDLMRAQWQKWGGDLTELAILKPQSLGVHQALKPQWPVLQWYGTKLAKISEPDEAPDSV